MQNFMTNTPGLFFNEQGMLQCARCSSDVKWCSHRSNFLEEYQDASIWSDRLDSYLDAVGARALMVPIVPQYGVYAECDFHSLHHDDDDDPESEFPKADVVWRMTLKDSIPSIRAHSLGRYTPGEGMFTWGAQIWELFLGLYAEEYIERGCKATIHNLQSSNNHKRMLADSQESRLAEAWSIATTTRCTHCNALQVSWMDDESIIPEVATRGFPKPQSLSAFHSRGLVDMNELYVQKTLQARRNHYGK